MEVSKGAKRSESYRNRQVNRYLGAWREVQQLLYGPPSPPTLGFSSAVAKASVPKASSDKALTAFAQLATLRLNVTRAVISLIATGTEHILAEATQTISLMKTSRHDEGDQLAFGKLDLSRDESIAYGVLNSSTTVADPKGQELSVDAFVLQNALEEEKFKNNEIVQKQQIRFFAAVPIMTLEGVVIGAYSVISTESRGDLTFPEYQFLQDVSSTVFEHLILVRDRLNSVSGASMVNGLTDFIGRSEMTIDYPSDNEEVPASNYTDEMPSALKEPQDDTPSLANGAGPRVQWAALSRQNEDTGADSQVSASSPPERQAMIESRPSSPVSTTPSMLTSIEVDLKTMFDQAAKLMQRCTQANGCIFLEATTDISQRHGFQQKDTTEDTDSSPAPSLSRRSRSDDHIDSVNGTQSESDASNLSEPPEEAGKISSILGSSFHLQGKVKGESGYPTFSCTEQDLKRCIRRYPGGKIFNFNDEGTISSGEDTLSDHSTTPRSNVITEIKTSSRSKHHRDPTRTRKFLAQELVKIIPGVKSVIFLPLWDFSQDRWYAGLFLWTTEIGRLMDTNDEFPYIRAFGHCIMNEVSRLTAVHAERAKTTFIASISHELRSPLHGILGSVEFIQDTKLDSFQHSLVNSVEICGKTLLDTIDHVLDYAKINYFGLLESRHAKTRNQKQQKSRTGVVSHTNRTSTFNISTLVEEVIEAVYAGQTFKQSKAGSSTDVFEDSGVARRPNLQPQQPGLSNSTQQFRRFSNGMTVVLDIDPEADQIISSQPGALRRIVMNLFGNALKYSYADKGLVKVTLRRSKQTSQDIHGHIPIELLIADTGKGMSADYLRHKLYRPFSQEDPFSVGTGLGLSIVRQIVTSLKGKIYIKSEQGRGTDITVNLKLPLVKSSVDHEQKHFSVSTKNKTRGLRVCILDIQHIRPSAERSRKSMFNSLSNMFKTWFGMDVTTAHTMDDSEADFYVFPEVPLLDDLRQAVKTQTQSQSASVIVICTNTFEEAALKSSGIGRILSPGWILEAISQPCGPLKMSHAIESCFRNRDANSRVIKDPLEPMVDITATDTQPANNHATGPVSEEARRLLQLDTKTSAAAVNGRTNGMVADNERCQEKEEDTNKTFRSSPELTDSDFASPITPGLQQTLNTNLLNLNILLVDDNSVNLQLLVAFINKLSLPHTSASNGLEAFEAYQEQHNAGRPFTHILMDINMPIMDGLESTRAIRQYERQHGAHRAMIVALTGMAGQSIQEEAVQIGFDHYFSKPVRFRELRKLVLSD